jgi:hypothetical protein
MGDGHTVVAAGRCDNARFRDFAGEQIGKRASSLERAGVLQKFQFEDQADRIQAEVGARSFEDGRAAQVRPDDFFNRFDALGIELGALHCGHLSNTPSVGLL